MKNRTELNLGKVFYAWLIYHIQDSWLNSLNGYDIYFWLRDTANQPYTGYASKIELDAKINQSYRKITITVSFFAAKKKYRQY